MISIIMETNEKKKYLKEYYKKHKADWYIQQQCEICGSKYNRSTRSRHFKSKKHIIAAQNLQIKNLQEKIETIEKNTG
jgi:hypothetical protein